MKTTAAVLVETGRPLELADLEIPALKPGQVLVEVAFSGVCHTQLLEARGHRGEDRFLPHCLGHEGSGIVREVGAGVTRVEPRRRGHPVVDQGRRSGRSRHRLRVERDRSVNAGAITTFATHSVISENRLTPIPDRPLDAARGARRLRGADRAREWCSTRRSRGRGRAWWCSASAGWGRAPSRPRQLCGCQPVIAVDVNADKFSLAEKLGATRSINSRTTDPVAVIHELCRGGADFAIEATGNPAVMRQALACVRPQGGTAVIVGNAKHGQTLEIDPRELNQGKRLLGTWGGDNVPDRDYPRYGRLIAAGKLNVEPLLGRTYGLLDVNAALDDLERGRVPDPLLEIGGMAKSVFALGSSRRESGNNAHRPRLRQHDCLLRPAVSPAGRRAGARAAGPGGRQVRGAGLPPRGGPRGCMDRAAGHRLRPADRRRGTVPGSPGLPRALPPGTGPRRDRLAQDAPAVSRRRTRSACRRARISPIPRLLRVRQNRTRRPSACSSRRRWPGSWRGSARSAVPRSWTTCPSSLPNPRSRPAFGECCSTRRGAAPRTAGSIAWRRGTSAAIASWPDTRSSRDIARSRNRRSTHLPRGPRTGARTRSLWPAVRTTASSGPIASAAGRHSRVTSAPSPIRGTAWAPSSRSAALRGRPASMRFPGRSHAIPPLDSDSSSSSKALVRKPSPRPLVAQAAAFVRGLERPRAPHSRPRACHSHPKRASRSKSTWVSSAAGPIGSGTSSRNPPSTAMRCSSSSAI